jgi:aryl-alcohol dehydrogenase-like predicted oxidoreductase
LGGTGIQVTPYALGAMMLGAMGNPDHDDSVRIIHKALDAGINFVDTAVPPAIGSPDLRRRPPAERSAA